MVRPLIASACFFGLVCQANAASACAVVLTRAPSQTEQMAAARKTIDEASAIIDVEVVRAARENRPALVYAYRVLKGPRREWFEVASRDSCDDYLQSVGERVRLILSGGPDIYYSKASGYAILEDRLLGSDRRRDWPYRDGAQPIGRTK